MVCLYIKSLINTHTIKYPIINLFQKYQKDLIIKYIASVNQHRTRQKKMLKWLFCCSQKQTQTQTQNTQNQLHKTNLASNIQLTIRYLQKNIYNNRVTNLNQMKIMFIKQLSKEEQFSEPSRLMSAMRRSNTGIRQYKIKLEQVEDRLTINCKIYEHSRQMSDILMDIKKSVAMSDRFQISLFFDAEVEEFKKQILEDVLKQFRALESVKGNFQIFITENSQEGVKEIMGICQQVKNNSLESTDQFFKKNSGYQTVASRMMNN